MSTLRIQLLGHLSIHGQSRSVDHLAATRSSEVLCYLLLHQQTSHSREKLSEVLWDGLPTPQARKQLRQALWQLQTTFDALCDEATIHILTVDTERVRMTPNENVWLDINDFAQAYAGVRDVGGEELDPGQVGELRRAVTLYQGDLLEGWYHPWCLIDRERYHAMHLAMLDKLMEACEAGHDYEEALDYGMRILRFDRAREATHLRMMRLYYLVGDRTAALRQFDRCVDALREDLDVSPAQRTDSLYHQIRADCLDDAGMYANTCPLPASAKLLNVLRQLDQAQATLDGIRRNVRQQLMMDDHSIRTRPNA